MIIFEKEIIKAKIKSPLANFSVVENEVEIRKDPLTSRICRINVERAKRFKQIKITKTKIENVVKKTKSKCFFCQKNIEKLTPKFFGIKERILKGNSVVFPNLFPFGQYHAVVVLNKKRHYFTLNKFDSKMLLDSFEASIEFFKIANEKDPEFKFPSINFNFLPSAGASIFHPHFQITLDKKPTFFTKVLLEKSLEYHEKFNSNFWLDLIDEEKKREERFLGEIGSFSWIADFAPFKNYQISGIINERISSFDNMKRKHIKDLSLSLEVIFKKLHKNGVEAINFSIFSGPLKEDLSDYFLINMKIVSRPSISKFYVSDIGFMELLHSEPVIETLPEEIAKSLRFKEKN